MGEGHLIMKMSGILSIYILLLIIVKIVIISNTGCMSKIEGNLKKIPDTSHPGNILNHANPFKYDYSSSMLHNGLTRTYSIHIGNSYDYMKSTPLVFVLHGGGGNGQDIMKHTNFNVVADRENFILVYPDGFENHWNDGRGVQWQAQIENVDDVGFISALIEKLSTEYNIDSRRIFVTGISNGGMMSHRLACELTEHIAAIAPVASNIPVSMVSKWKPSQPVSVLIINGTEDPLERWDGGEIRLGNNTYGVVLSVADTVKFWTDKNRCMAQPVSKHLSDNKPFDGTSVITTVYRGCDGNIEVVLYQIEGGGHTWPGGIQYLPQSIIGKTSREFNASEVIWQFFKEHPKK
jgi:polyhydroxybutyrate depolymerase